MNPEWYYNELLQTGVDYTDIAEVERYDARMGRLRNIKGEIDVIVDALKPSPDSTILEIGCGTGEFAIAISGLCRKLYALDVSSVMLDYSRKKAASRNVDNIEFRNAGFLTFNHSGVEFDHIYTQLALHHLPDFWKLLALKKIHGLLKPGGKFFLRDVVYPSDIDDYDMFFDEIIRSLEESAGSEFTQEYFEHIRKEFSTLDWIMENLLVRAGFTITHSSVEDGFLATFVCTKQLMADSGNEAAGALNEKTKDISGKWVATSDITCKNHLQIRAGEEFEVVRRFENSNVKITKEKYIGILDENLLKDSAEKK